MTWNGIQGCLLIISPHSSRRLQFDNKSQSRTTTTNHMCWKIQLRICTKHAGVSVRWKKLLYVIMQRHPTTHFRSNNKNSGGSDASSCKLDVCVCVLKLCISFDIEIGNWWRCYYATGFPVYSYDAHERVRVALFHPDTLMHTQTAREKNWYYISISVWIKSKTFVKLRNLWENVCIIRYAQWNHFDSHNNSFSEFNEYTMR